MRLPPRFIRTALATLSACLATPGAAQALAVHVARPQTPGAPIGVRFGAPALPEGGYYYAVVVLERYRHYTQASPRPAPRRATWNVPTTATPRPAARWRSR